MLASARLVVLAETPLSAAQAQLFIDHVNAGGRLVAMRPDSRLAATLGVIPAGTSQTNGYLAINQAQPSGAGLAAMTLPFAGAADHYTPVGGNQTLATLYSSLTTATPYAAVVRSGRTATWAFDLARSVAYRRQGDPALSGVERDGILPVPDDGAVLSGHRPRAHVGAARRRADPAVLPDHRRPARRRLCRCRACGTSRTAPAR